MDIAEKLKLGMIGVLPTDTIYGVVGIALDFKVVEKIYKVKKRTPAKPFIILVSDIEDLKLFSINLDMLTLDILNKYWPGPVSIILECTDDRFEYLHRGTKTLAFRLPANNELRDILKISGPLVAPSANPEGETPATNITEAKNYFEDEVDFYVEGKTNSKPSKIIKITEGNEEIIRP